MKLKLIYPKWNKLPGQTTFKLPSYGPVAFYFRRHFGPGDSGKKTRGFWPVDSVGTFGTSAEVSASVGNNK